MNPEKQGTFSNWEAERHGSTEKSETVIAVERLSSLLQERGHMERMGRKVGPQGN